MAGLLLHPRVRIESLAFDEASRLIPSKAGYSLYIYGTAEAVPFVQLVFRSLLVECVINWIIYVMWVIL
jgi:hypothetical protein